MKNIATLTAFYILVIFLAVTIKLNSKEPPTEKAEEPRPITEATSTQETEPPTEANIPPPTTTEAPPPSTEPMGITLTDGTRLVLDKIDFEAEREYTYYAIPLSDELQEYTQTLCRIYEVDYKLALAVMSVESDFRPNLISRTNDYGIMQINKVNHKRLKGALGITDFLDPYQNILAGVAMLSELNGYSTTQALMIYNCGASGAKNLWEKGIKKTAYTDKVQARMEKLEERK